MYNHDPISGLIVDPPVGVANFVLMPFVLMFMLVHFFMKNAEELHSKKDYLGPREWSPLGMCVIYILFIYVVCLFLSFFYTSSSEC